MISLFFRNVVPSQRNTNNAHYLLYLGANHKVHSRCLVLRSRTYTTSTVILCRFPQWCLTATFPSCLWCLIRLRYDPSPPRSMDLMNFNDPFPSLQTSESHRLDCNVRHEAIDVTRTHTRTGTLPHQHRILHIISRESEAETHRKAQGERHRTHSHLHTRIATPALTPCLSQTLRSIRTLWKQRQTFTVRFSVGTRHMRTASLG